MGISEKEAYLVDDGYKQASYNLQEYLKEEEDDYYAITKKENTLTLKVGIYEEIEYHQERLEGDILSDLTDEWEIL